MTDSATESTWLEQFKITAKESLLALEEVVKAGLQPLENQALIEIAAKLIELAEIHDPEALAKVEELLGHESP